MKFMNNKCDILDLNEHLNIDQFLQECLGESWGGPSLAESLEKHETLNQAIWDGENLKEDVKIAINEIVQKYVEDSSILSMDDIIDVELVGSNASYNYTQYSDLDVHLVVNMEALSSDPLIVQIACNAEKLIFNKTYSFMVKGVEVELYVEDVKTGTASNGVYSVTNDKWVKKPEPIDIPDFIDDDEYLTILDAWMIKAKQALNSNTSKEIHQFINELYNLRRLSIMSEGEYAKGNLVFKEIRNAGLLQELKDKVSELTSKELSLESLQKD